MYRQNRVQNTREKTDKQQPPSLIYRRDITASTHAGKPSLSRPFAIWSPALLPPSSGDARPRCSPWLRPFTCASDSPVRPHGDIQKTKTKHDRKHTQLRKAWSVKSCPDEAEPSRDEAEPSPDDEAEPSLDDEAEPSPDDEAEPSPDDEAEPVSIDESTEVSPDVRAEVGPDDAEPSPDESAEPSLDEERAESSLVVLKMMGGEQSDGALL
ncbi:hypothetical protein DFS34DRAFT_678790 [Phlyctochytrium arcticum]|nr:hypothetical protein DFS34DRAFT_678790 [Phlyctochytrium arcticum]